MRNWVFFDRDSHPGGTCLVGAVDSVARHTPYSSPSHDFYGCAFGKQTCRSALCALSLLLAPQSKQLAVAVVQGLLPQRSRAYTQQKERAVQDTVRRIRIPRPGAERTRDRLKNMSCPKAVSKEKKVSPGDVGRSCYLTIPVVEVPLVSGLMSLSLLRSAY